jgi:hypothetical protein
VPEIDRQQARVSASRSAPTPPCAAGDLRGAGDTRRGLRHPHPGPQKIGAGNRRPPVSVTGSAQPHAAHPPPESPLPGRQLGYAQTGRGEVEHHVSELT